MHAVLSSEIESLGLEVTTLLLKQPGALCNNMREVKNAVVYRKLLDTYFHPKCPLNFNLICLRSPRCCTRIKPALCLKTESTNQALQVPSCHERTSASHVMPITRNSFPHSHSLRTQHRRIGDITAKKPTKYVSFHSHVFCIVRVMSIDIYRQR